MSKKFKDVSIKNHTYYFFDDIINIRKFDSINIKIDEISYKNILIYHTRYVMIKDSIHIKTNSVNQLYFIFSKMNGYFEEMNGNKCLTLVLTNEIKEKN